MNVVNIVNGLAIFPLPTCPSAGHCEIIQGLCPLAGDHSTTALYLQFLSFLSNFNTPNPWSQHNQHLKQAESQRIIIKPGASSRFCIRLFFMVYNKQDKYPYQ